MEVTLNSDCQVRDSVQVSFYPDAPHPLPREVALCQGETVLLDASPLQGPYHWSNGSTGSNLQVSQAGEYWVEVLWGACLVRESSQVKVNPLPFLELRGDSLLCYGQSQLLEALGQDVSFRWQDGSRESQFRIQVPGTYWVEATDQLTGCVKRDSLQVQSNECWATLQIPNIITPNGDTKNQSFIIEGLTDHWGLEIFNRWGSRVYQATSYENDWDANDQSNGVYYYLLRNRVSGQSFTGWLQVLR